MSEVYEGFDNWEDVQKRFEMKEPKPEKVLLARYDCGGYDGHADVIYKNGEKYYRVTAGHCSCYGLEGSWDPEEYQSKESLFECLKRERISEYEKEAHERLLASVEAS